MSALQIQPYESEAYKRYMDAYGVFEIFKCQTDDDSLDNHRAILAHALAIEPDKLMPISPQEIDERTFHGQWFDYDRGKLIHGGTLYRDGKPLVNLPFEAIDFQPSSASHSLGDIWEPGNFSYAFSTPPYSTKLSYRETQEVYTSVIDDIAPRGQCRILSWQQEALIDAAPFMAGGTEWWGVYVFTIYNQATGRLFALEAAETD